MLIFMPTQHDDLSLVGRPRRTPLQQRARDFGPPLPRSPRQQPTVGALVVADALCASGAPRLEEERHVGRFGLIPHRQRSFRPHRPGGRPRLAAADHLADPVQVQRPQVLQQGFHRQEPHAGGHWAKKVDARQAVAAIFHRDADPDVGRDRAGREETGQPLGAAIAWSRSALRSAQPCLQPADTWMQPVTGFQVGSVHSMRDRRIMVQRPRVGGEGGRLFRPATAFPHLYGRGAEIHPV